MKIAIAEDHILLRNLVSSFIESNSNYKVVIQASDGLDLIEQIEKCSIKPDMCLVDIRMPKLDGFETTKIIKQKWSGIRILVLTCFDKQYSFARALANGANGYITKVSMDSELMIAIDSVFNNGLYVPRQFSRILEKMFSDKRNEFIFSHKEIEFIKLCCSEMTYTEIAQKMFLSQSALEYYRKKVFVKLDIKSRGGIIEFALKNGFMH